MRLTSLSALILVLAAAINARATTWDVYLLAGQSNMDGRGKTADLKPEQRKPMKNVTIFYRSPPLETKAFEPMAPGFTGKATGTIPSPMFGPELGFAMAMNQAEPDRKIALIKGSKGGTSLSKDWNPGKPGESRSQGPCYRDFLETYELATKKLTANGDRFVVHGLLWHQGESDASSTTEVYQQRLTAFIARIREDLKQPELPFVIGEVFDNGKRDAVRKAQHAVAQTVPHVGFAAADGLNTSDKGTHFDAVSQVTLGKRFAIAMLALDAKSATDPG